MNTKEDRTILHCDMNGFFASVELLSYPELVNKPMAVCGSVDNRHGIILAKNEIAKKYGIITAETLWQAKKKCPNLATVPPHMDKYKHYSKLINEVYNRYTDMVEPFSIDESWLDVTGSKLLFGDGKTIADTIRSTVKNELGLTLSAGVSYNKVFAKMGSEYKKPDATTLITRSNYKDLLWSMPVSKLFFVGKATAEKLIKANINTIGKLAQTDKNLLQSMLGKQGAMLYDYANGLDNSPVSFNYERSKIKSVGNGTTFKRNLTCQEDIKTALIGLSDTVASRLRKYEMKAMGVKIDIKDPYFKVISRQKQLENPTNLAEVLYKTAMELLAAFWGFENPIRLLTITAINLCNENEKFNFEEQLSIFSTISENITDNAQNTEKLERTMDAIRTKFGTGSITYGCIINNDIGIDL